MKWSPEARLVSSRAALALLDGGTLCTYAGNRKASEHRFSDPACHGDHLNPIAPDESAPGSGGEDVDNFVASGKDGTAYAEGTVGKTGTGADCEMKSLRIPRGAKVEIESLHFTPGA